MKLLTITNSDTIGGAARIAFRIHTALTSKGIDSKMLVIYKNSNDDNVISKSETIRKNKLIRFYYNLIFKVVKKYHQLNWSKYTVNEDAYLSGIFSLPPAKLIQKFEFDILQIHWINGLHFNLVELKAIKRPIVWTLHDCWAFTGVCHYFYNCNNYEKTCGSCPFLNSNHAKDLSYINWKKKKKIYDSLDLRIITPSNWLAEAARRSSLLSRFQVTVIPNLINTHLFSPGDGTLAYSALGLDSNKIYMLFSAMKVFDDKNKGFEKLKEALNYLKNGIRYLNLELLVIGSGTPPKTWLSDIPAKFLGTYDKDDLMVLAYRVATLTIVPSFSENLSNTIMESMACGTPVVAFDTGGNNDLVDHKINGYLAVPFAPEDLANGILWCIDKNHNRELSDRVREKVIKNFTVEKITDRYKEIYYSIIG